MTYKPQHTLPGNTIIHKFMSVGAGPHGSIVEWELESLLGYSFVSVLSWSPKIEP